MKLKGKMIELTPVLKLDTGSMNEYTYDPEPQSGECVWITFGKMAAVIKRTDEGYIIDCFAKGHEDWGSIESAVVFDEALREEEE